MYPKIKFWKFRFGSHPTQAPVTAAPISKTDTNTPSNVVNNGNSVNTPNDVTVSVITNEPVNQGGIIPDPAEPVEDNNTDNSNDNNTVDTNNDTGNTDPVVDNSANNPVNTPATEPAPIVTSAINAATVDSKSTASTPAVDLPGTAAPNSAAASLTISLLFGIIINLL